ncbi:MAG: flagellar hook protein FlgE [Firmicutes bacterium]|nr:flagellar hook protein FlgE [Bacillota bacterium]
MTVMMNFETLTQYAGESTLQATNGDGYPAGTLDMSKLTIDQSGIITATFTNGKSKSLGQVASAVFNNPGGLTKAGENLYAKSNNSGDPQIGTGGSGGRGTFTAGSLEMSNVDLAQQFSDMIITQRGFQANSKIITTTDEMLELLANLKR